jgi:hypothetical protein
MPSSGPPSGDLSPADVRTGADTLASGKPPNDPDSVVGRDAELTAIRRLLSDARAGESGALLIEGDPGIGKTTLLDAARFWPEGSPA